MIELHLTGEGEFIFKCGGGCDKTVTRYDVGSICCKGDKFFVSAPADIIINGESLIDWAQRQYKATRSLNDFDNVDELYGYNKALTDIINKLNRVIAPVKNNGYNKLQSN